MKTEIILIDDDPLSLLLSKFVLEKSFVPEGSVKFTTFTFPKEGLSHIQRLIKTNNGVGNHLKVLLDINMPGINGWEFLEELNTCDPGKTIRVIMHSSSRDKQDISKALTEKRVDNYICKPMESSKALQIVNSFNKSDFACFHTKSRTN